MDYKAFTQLKGKVKFFNVEKGYGFITSESGEELFFHISNVDNPSDKLIKAGDKVQYMYTGASPKGIEAKAVQFL